jgi:GDP-4-dehydro-6-deoxy-D-mannose reductase
VSTNFWDPPSVPVEWKLDAELIECDVRDTTRVRKTIHQIRPNLIFHLAAKSSPFESLTQTKNVYELNFWGTYNLLEATRQLLPKARVLVVGSGQCYGDVGTSRPIRESKAFAPPNPYALSKAAADMLASQYHSRFGLHVIRARPFNHTGPGQQQGFVCSDYARQIVAINSGLERPVLRVRNPQAKRDFTDVRDVVRAYELLLRKANPGEAYNVASGRTISVRDIVSLLVSFSSRPIRLSEERQRLRSGDVSILFGSSLKLRRATGWKPRYNMVETLRDLFEYWKIHSSRKLNRRSETSLNSQGSRERIRESTA